MWRAGVLTLQRLPRKHPQKADLRKRQWMIGRKSSSVRDHGAVFPAMHSPCHPLGDHGGINIGMEQFTLYGFKFWRHKDLQGWEREDAREKGREEGEGCFLRASRRGQVRDAREQGRTQGRGARERERNGMVWRWTAQQSVAAGEDLVLVQRSTRTSTPGEHSNSNYTQLYDTGSRVTWRRERGKEEGEVWRGRVAVVTPTSAALSLALTSLIISPP